MAMAIRFSVDAPVRAQDSRASCGARMSSAMHIWQRRSNLGFIHEEGAQVEFSTVSKYNRTLARQTTQ